MNTYTAFDTGRIWDAWVQKGRLQDKATARKIRLLGIAVVIVAVAAVFYMFAVGRGNLVQT